jgi:hypothetical protein
MTGQPADRFAGLAERPCPPEPLLDGALRPLQKALRPAWQPTCVGLGATIPASWYRQPALIPPPSREAANRDRKPALLSTR